MRVAFHNSELSDAADLLATLKALSWFYQTTHWQVRGRNFYGDHLLFERLYETVQAEIDMMAEKAVGLYGVQVVDLLDSVQRVTRAFSNSVSDCPYDAAFSLESRFQDLLRRTIGEGMPIGYKAFLEGLADTHENNMYLLKQRFGRDRRIEAVEKNVTLTTLWFGE